MRISISMSAILIVCVLVAGCGSKEIAPEPVEMNTAPAVSLLLTPAEKLTSGDLLNSVSLASMQMGKRTNAVGAIQWSTMGLEGTLQPIPFAPDKNVTTTAFTPDKNAGAHAGRIFAESGDMKAAARVRVIPSLPWSEDFETIELEKIPTHWIGATGKFFVRQKGGGKVLVKTPVQRGLNRSNVYLGPSTMKDYQIQVDLMGTKDKRRLPDMGLIANRYTLDMQGRHQRLQIRSWASDLRMAKTIDFPWDTEVWYTMKMMVEIALMIKQSSVEKYGGEVNLNPQTGRSPPKTRSQIAREVLVSTATPQQ